MNLWIADKTEQRARTDRGNAGSFRHPDDAGAADALFDQN